MELAAIVRANGRISIGSPQRLACTLNTDHPPLARKIIRLLKANFSLQTEVLVMRRQRLRKNLSYMVRILPQQGVEAMLKAIGIVDDEGQLQDWVELPELEHDHCRRAYLRGTFLGTGWVSSPDRQHHLEFTTVNTEAADALGQMLFRYGIPVRMAYRKESMLLYIKDAAHITRFLNVVGAHQALLHYEDVRVLKGMKNLVNRQVNAETANLGKTVEASARQLEAIELLRADGRLHRAAKSVQELAMLRVNHPDASLRELGEMCNPPVGKSGVNHRMRLIMQMAER